MSSFFESEGKVSEVKSLTSQKGKPYSTFVLTTGDGHKLNFSLFGNSMSFKKFIVEGKSVAVKGALESREYQGKHYPQLTVQWVEGTKTPSASTTPEVKSNANDMAEIPF